MASLLTCTIAELFNHFKQVSGSAYTSIGTIVGIKKFNTEYIVYIDTGSHKILAADYVVIIYW